MRERGAFEDQRRQTGGRERGDHRAIGVETQRVDERRFAREACERIAYGDGLTVPCRPLAQRVKDQRPDIVLPRRGEDRVVDDPVPRAALRRGENGSERAGCARHVVALRRGRSGPRGAVTGSWTAMAARIASSAALAGTRSVISKRF